MYLKTLPLSRTKLIFYRNSDDAASIDIAATFHLPSGPGATCVLKSPHVLSNFIKNHYVPALLREDFFDSMCSTVFQNSILFSDGNFSRASQNVLSEELLKSHISKER